MQSKYTLDERPGIGPLLLYGLQWWVVSLPCVIIMGVIVARLHFDDIALQTVYVQKLFGLVGVVTIAQVLIGHRLPLIVGPAAILLVGLIASTASSIASVYTAVLVGGAGLTMLALSGLLSRLRFFFTSRIVAAILILIAFTITPTILRLMTGTGARPAFDLSFGILLVLALVVCNKVLPGIWKSLTVILGIAGGSFLYFLLTAFPVIPELRTAETFLLPLGGLEFHLGTVLSFVFCFLALLINELGSIESVGFMLDAGDMAGRIKKGTALQGVANIAAGGLEVIGTVDYSLSAGIIAATGCASRYPLVPAGLGLVFCAFVPDLVLLLSCIPGVVMGALMLYLMSSQLASGLSMLVSEKGVTDFSSGLTVGLPLMLGLLIAFAPGSTFNGFPDLLRPILGNGFVMGTIAVVILEHVVFRNESR